MLFSSDAIYNIINPLIYFNAKNIPSDGTIEDIGSLGQYAILIKGCMFCILFAASAMIIPLWWWKSKERTLRIILCCTHFTPLLGCFLSYYGYGRLYVGFQYESGIVYRAKNVFRYIEWGFAVTTLLLSLKIIAERSRIKYNNMPLEKLYTWHLSWWAVMLFGALGALSSEYYTKCGFFIIGCMYMSPIAFGVSKIFGTTIFYPTIDSIAALKSGRTRRELCEGFYAQDPEFDREEHKHLRILRIVLVLYCIWWILYPLIWIPCELSYLSVDTELLLFCILDTISNGVFANCICNVGCTLFDSVETYDMKQAQKLSKMRSDFFLNVNHELRTPLNAVIGLSQIVLDSDNLTSQQETTSQSIVVSAQTLLFTINDVLDFSRLESQGMKIDKISFNLEKCMEETADIIAVKAHEKKLDLMLQIRVSKNQLKLLNHTIGDPFRVRQILINIANNAVKFTPEYGSVYVKLEIISSNKRQVLVKFSVSDTGLGIPAHHIPTLFEPFSRATDNTQKKFGGTGLGLSICKKLVTLMGGRIYLQSTTLGVGTTFGIEIPFALEMKNSEEQEKLIDLHGLVIESNSAWRDNIKSICSLSSLSVTTVSTASVALKVLKSEKRRSNSNVCTFDFLIVEVDNFTNFVNMVGGEKELFQEFSKVFLVNEFTGAQINESLISSYQNNKSPFTSQVKFITKPIKRTHLHNFIRQTEEGTSTKQKGHEKNHKLKILVAEDNAVNQKVAGMMLRKLGCEFDLVGNGRDAYQAALHNKYDAIFMDVQMPIMDGIKAVEMIRAAERTGTIADANYILALTAGSTPENFDRCTKAGMNGFLTKPIEFSTVKSVIESLSANCK